MNRWKRRNRNKELRKKIRNKQWKKDRNQFYKPGQSRKKTAAMQARVARDAPLCKCKEPVGAKRTGPKLFTAYNSNSLTHPLNYWRLFLLPSQRKSFTRGPLHPFLVVLFPKLKKKGKRESRSIRWKHQQLLLQYYLPCSALSLPAYSRFSSSSCPSNILLRFSSSPSPCPSSSTPPRFIFLLLFFLFCNLSLSPFIIVVFANTTFLFLHHLSQFHSLFSIFMSSFLPPSPPAISKFIPALN